MERGTHDWTRRRNRALILQELMRDSCISRVQIAARTGMTNSVVSRITREMLEVGLLNEQGEFRETEGPGRSSIKLELSQHGAYVVGVSMSASNQWVRLTNARGEMLRRKPLSLDSFNDPRRVIAGISKVVHDVIKSSSIEPRRVLGCGLGISGIVDKKTGALLRSVNLGWGHVDLQRELMQGLNLPVCIESVPNAVNLAEMRAGLTKGRRNAVLLILGATIGASFIVDGRLLRGRGNAASQIGHMRTEGAMGTCICGQRGCLDTLASGRAILMRLGMKAGLSEAMERTASDARELMEAIAREEGGDEVVQRLFREAGAAVGRALDAVVAAVDPETIILGGPLSHARSYFEGVRSGAREGLFERVSVVVSRMPIDEAAAWLALDQFLLSESLDMARLNVD